MQACDAGVQALDVGGRMFSRVSRRAIRQARHEVAIQVSAHAVFIAVSGLPRRLAWTVGIVAAGAVTTMADLRWWLWLGEATPAEAFDRLQSRSGLDGAALGPWLTRLVSISMFAAPWLLAR